MGHNDKYYIFISELQIFRTEATNDYSECDFWEQKPNNETVYNDLLFKEIECKILMEIDYRYLYQLNN